MSTEDEPSRSFRDWAEDRGFKMAKLFPVDTESAVAELYFGDRMWAYVSLQGIDDTATGVARLANVRVVAEFWSDPDKPDGAWDFSLDLHGAMEQLRLAEAWLLENEKGRAASSGEQVTAAERALSQMSEDEQARWLGKSSTSASGDESPG
jgi:hypothetical protein